MNVSWKHSNYDGVRDGRAKWQRQRKERSWLIVTLVTPNIIKSRKDNRKHSMDRHCDAWTQVRRPDARNGIGPPCNFKRKIFGDHMSENISQHELTDTKVVLPNVGDEVLVDICPCPDGDSETWMQMGKVLASWYKPEHGQPFVLAAIEITRELSPEENRGGQSDKSWHGCVFVCRWHKHSTAWRALWPASDRTDEMWGCGEE
jgi:hypothetical protein